LASSGRRYTLQAELNWHILTATETLSLMTNLLFDLTPALQSTQINILSALKESRTNHPIIKTRRSQIHMSLNQVLIVAQISITLVILVATKLFMRTLSNLQSIVLGFNREN